MITAKEARAISKQMNDQVDERIMFEIERNIKVACEEGRTQISCDGTISCQLMQKLSDLGYVVNKGDQYQESYFTVEW